MQNKKTCVIIHKHLTNGPLVKRLRHGPLKAETWVRFPYGSPKTKGHQIRCPFCFWQSLRIACTLQACLDWGRIVCPVVPCRNLARQGIFPYKFSIAPCLAKICLFALTLLEERVRIFDQDRCLLARKRLGRNSSRSEPSRLLLRGKSTGHSNFFIRCHILGTPKTLQENICML